MIAPINWLKDYVAISFPLKDLMWRMTEVGMTTEAYHETEGETVLDIEVTPNRPDWLCLLGIAREIAAIQGSKIKTPEIKSLPSKKADLPISVSTDFSLCPRYSAVLVSGVSVKESPQWLKDRLKLVGLRPINNLVDITNFVMFELGVPIHVFDYGKFENKKLIMKRAAGGESFTSVDGLTYELPKNTIIIKDGEKVIDLCGLKGGEATGVSENTKNIFIHVPIYTPQMIRRTSQSLKLSSEASYIYERGANAGGTIDSLKRVVELTLKLAGGQVASDLIDIKNEKFEEKKLKLNLARLEKVLGLKIPNEKVISILASLNLTPKKGVTEVECRIPSYRGDLKIEEDLIEEVARIYGYNKFPKTLPIGETPKEKIPYFFDDSFHLTLKGLLAASGFNEVLTYSLISEDVLAATKQRKENYIKLSNPVSLDFEYLRRSLVPNLLAAIRLNPNEKKLKLFELGKVYLGSAEKADETYFVSGIQKGENFSDAKGVLDYLFARLNLGNNITYEAEESNALWHPFKSGSISVGQKTIGLFGAINPLVLDSLGIKDEVFAFELDIAAFTASLKPRVYQPIPKYPAQIEDMTLSFPERTKIGEVINAAKEISRLVSHIELVDTYGNSYTFRLWYQDPKKTLTDEEVQIERKKILKELTRKFGAGFKD